MYHQEESGLEENGLASIEAVSRNEPADNACAGFVGLEKREAVSRNEPALSVCWLCSCVGKIGGCGRAAGNAQGGRSYVTLVE